MAKRITVTPSTITTSLRAIALNPLFRNLLVAHLFIKTGEGMFYTASAWLIYNVSRDPLAFGIYMTLLYLPSTLLAPFLGVIVDRYSRPLILLTSVALQGVCIFSIAFMWKYSLAPLPYIFAMTFGYGFAQQLYKPTVRAAFKEVIESEQILVANSRITIASNLGGFFGAAIAGWLLLWLPGFLVIAVDGSCFIVAVWFQFLLWRHLGYRREIKKKMTIDGSKIFSDLSESFNYVKARSEIGVLLCALVIINLTVPVVNFTYPIYLIQSRHFTSDQFGLTDALFGLGVVGGATILPFLHRQIGSIPLMIIGSMVLGALFASFAITEQPLNLMILSTLMGALYNVWLIYVSELQWQTPSEMHGRVLSFFHSCVAVLTVVLFQGLSFAIKAVGIQYCLFGFAAFLIVVVPVLLTNAKGRHVDELRSLGESKPKPSGPADSEALILFDGVCNFCNFWIQIIARLDQAQKMRFCSQNSELGQKIMRQYGIAQETRPALIYLRNEVPSFASSAVINILVDCGGMWRAVAIFKLIPKFIRDGVYYGITKYRYKLFGMNNMSAYCDVGAKERLLDAAQVGHYQSNPMIDK